MQGGQDNIYIIYMNVPWSRLSAQYLHTWQDNCGHYNGREVVIPAEFVVPNLYIAQATKMFEYESIAKHLQELWELDEHHFLAYFHESVEKQRQKAWHDRHIKNKSSLVGD